MEKIVLNIPHSSVNGIFDAIGKWPQDPRFISECVAKWTDWFTDFLFTSNNSKVAGVVFPYSRFVCDVERLDNDPMEAIGQGILYRRFNDFVRGKLSAEAENRLYALRREHLNRLKSQLTPGSVLIDCHSFPSELHECDICIGFNDDQTYDERLVQAVKQQFEDMHYVVALNEPYSNSIAPDTGFTYKSLMIEVNKKVYLDGNCCLKQDEAEWHRWFSCINNIYRGILDMLLRSGESPSAVRG